MCYQEASIDAQMASVLGFLIVLRKGMMADFFMSLEDDYTRVGHSFFSPLKEASLCLRGVFALVATKQSGWGRTPSRQIETKKAIIQFLHCQCIH